LPLAETSCRRGLGPPPLPWVTAGASASTYRRLHLREAAHGKARRLPPRQVPPTWPPHTAVLASGKGRPAAAGTVQALPGGTPAAARERGEREVRGSRVLSPGHREDDREAIPWLFT
jgi:hypothetical protein